MIYTERKITISNSGASIDSPIILYRGDKEIEILFTIVDSKFKFSSEKGNYIINTGAKFAQLAVDLPDGTDLFTDISECLDGAVLFKITGDMIDEIREIGFYSFHIRLFDESRESRITIPPVLKGIEIKSPMVTESTVGYATADNSRVDDNKESFIDEDGKLTIEWKKGDVISSVKLNQMVEVVNNAVDEEKQRQQNELVRQNNEEIRQDAIEYAVETYDMTINDLNAEKNKIKPYVDNILESAISEHVIAFTEVEGSVISELSFDGYLKDIEILGNTIQDADNLADIRSVGYKVENQELYEIPVLSRGKNLLDIPKYYEKQIYWKANNYATLIAYVKINPNTDYTFTSKYSKSNNEIGHGGIGVYLFKSIPQEEDIWYITQKDAKYIYRNENPNVTINTTFNTENYKYLAVYLGVATNNSHNHTAILENTQLEEGTVATPYEPYVEDKLTILSPVQLEKVGDVADRIICKDGVWGVEKNVETATFDGSETYLQHSYTFENCQRFRTNNGIYGTSNYGICNTLITKAGDSALDSEGIKFTDTGNIDFVVSKNKVASADVNDFKKWLSENPTLVKYQLPQHQFIPLPYDQQIKLRTFANKTNIHFECEIEPTLKASVPKSLGATVNTHTTQIDNLNKELDRVKKLEESTVSTVTSDKAFTTIAETNGGYFEDVKIEGKTLVNLCPPIEVSYEATSDYDGYTPLQQSYGSDVSAIGKMLIDIKPNTEYTVFFKVIEKADSNNYNVNNTSNNKVVFDTKMLVNSVGLYIYKVKSKSDLSSCDVVLRMQNSNSRGRVHIKDFVILEGDHTQNPPEYFEGLKSVGQDVDEISVLSCNENLFDGVLEQGTYADGNGKPSGSTMRVRNANRFIPVSKNTLYCNSNSNYKIGDIYCYDINKIYLGWIGMNAISGNITLLPNTRYIDLIIKANNLTDAFEPLDVPNTIMISHNGNEYKPYKQYKKRILYYNDETQTWEKPILRQWDSIEKHSDGKYYYHKRSEEVVLNGSESWKDRSSVYTSDTQTRFSLIFNIKPCDWGEKSIICDKYEVLGALGEASSVTDNGIWQHTSGSQLYITVPKTTLSEFQAWLQANPIVVVYKLAEEKVYECTNLDLITYSGETNLLVKSGVLNPKVSLKVSKGVGNVVTMLQNKVAMLEQMVYNLMKMFDTQLSNIDE